MNLKNQGPYCQLRSENPIEAQALFAATRRNYSARSSGAMPNNDEMVEFNREDVEEFCSGVLRDVNIRPVDKWAIVKLLSCWMSGEIQDEAATVPEERSAK